MEFIQKDSPEDLSFYINKFVIVNNEQTSGGKFVSEIVPMGYHYLNIGFGKGFTYHYMDHSRQIKEGIVLNGMLRKQKVNLEAEAPFYIINCELKPTAIYDLFKCSATEFTDRSVLLENVIGEDHTSQLFKAIKEAKEDGIRIELIEFFIRTFAPGDTPEHYVHRAVELILERSGQITIQELAGELNIGIRQLEKKFKEMVGVPPSYYSNLIQFGHTLKIYENDPEISLQDLAYHGGYYDLPHMLKSFKRFVGTWPSQYKELQKRYVEEII